MSEDKDRDLDQEREKAFLAACLAKGQKPEGALAIYRLLVRTSFGNVVFKLLPRTRARMNALHADAFDVMLVDFLDEVGPRTHHLRDVPWEFLAYAAPKWGSAGIDPATLDLASYEAASFAAESAPDDDAKDLADIDLERGIVLTRSLQMVSLSHPVHELPEDLAPGASIEPRAVHLLVYRNAEHDIVELEVDAFFAALVLRLQAGDTLGTAVASASRSAAVTLEAGLPRAAAFLADLGARGALLGGRITP